jgi:DNA-binding MarR family transcriptional regulator
MSARDERFFFLLQIAAHRLKTRADAALVEAGGLTTAQTAMMSIIRAEGTVTQREIATRLKQRESAVGAMAERLLKAGYIARTRSDTDGRAWNLAATKKGVKAMEAMGAAFADINALIDEAFPARDMTRMAKGLRRLIELAGED